MADSLLTNDKKAEELIGENGLLKQLTKMLVARALEGEMTEHLLHDRSQVVSNASGNARNGLNGKTLNGDFGELPLKVPRDRQTSFEPQLVVKR